MRGMDIFRIIPSEIYLKSPNPTLVENQEATLRKSQNSQTFRSKTAKQPIGTKRPLERLHADLVGSIEPVTLGKQTSSST